MGPHLPDPEPGLDEPTLSPATPTSPVRELRDDLPWTPQNPRTSGGASLTPSPDPVTMLWARSSKDQQPMSNINGAACDPVPRRTRSSIVFEGASKRTSWKPPSSSFFGVPDDHGIWQAQCVVFYGILQHDFSFRASHVFHFKSALHFTVFRFADRFCFSVALFFDGVLSFRSPFAALDQRLNNGIDT